MGDVKINLYDGEVWGVSPRLDPLFDHFVHLFSSHNLFDVIPCPLYPTCSNGRSGKAEVAKRLDKFLLSESLGDSVG